MQVTQGTVLDGRVRHDQPSTGHRTGIEPVLLAAAIPARPGDRVLEGGCGVGTALLCLAHRVPDIVGVGIDRNADLVRLASANASANDFVGLTFVAGDLGNFSAEGKCDHTFANPPWHAADGTASPDAGREHARRGAPGLIATWTQSLASLLRPRGTLTLIIAAARLPECLSALDQAKCGSPIVAPFWPKAGAKAKLVLVSGSKGTHGPCRMLPGLVLHEADGRYTGAANAILREAAALRL